MKLKAFRIRNYRAIVDTGWVNLSPDNITTLIGQNESGKTTILEALYTFYTGEYHEDVLRSDLSLPYISCSFSAHKSQLESIIEPKLLKPEVYESIKTSGMIHLSRKWLDQKKSTVFFGNDKIIALYEDEKIRDEQAESELEETVHIILSETNSLTTDTSRCKTDIRDLDNKLSIARKKEVRLKKAVSKASEVKKHKLEEEYKTLSDEIIEIEKKISRLRIEYDGMSRRLDELTIASKYASLFLESGRDYKSIKDRLESINKDLHSKNLELRFCTDDKKAQLLRASIKELDINAKKKSEELSFAKERFIFNTECLSLAVSETKVENIEKYVEEKQKEKSEIMSIEHLGQMLFNHIPGYKLFEDFSSLLPNRIDLDDILNSNTSVEGYNAVKNFLIVSGLDASFFTEQNNRILKQKIENLNGELTLHFQDYWRQNVGRNNKIKINFELEHYDFSHPLKKGKPYLEFWIKDDHERLYPKQRSRGVRWFLSFYLELKATSLSNKSAANVLLIDEPGLSLHARAQEDVLKVFEDMKENIQIIYSTHSPHLVDISKLYRILAVQRADEYNDRSESLVFETQKLSNASGDTLSPIYSLIGTRLSESSFLQERNNLIVEDSHVFHYLNTLMKIFGRPENVYFLPANGVDNIPLLINLMIGWNLHYAVLLPDNRDGQIIYKELKEKLFKGQSIDFHNKVMITENLSGIEDVFSTIDFKKHILQQRVGITESNFEYIENSNLSREDLAAAFSLRFQEENLKPDDFDEETRNNVKILISKILSMIGN